MSAFLVTYDIHSDKNRAKMAKLLEGYGVRVQQSVFELTVAPNGVERLRRRALPLIDPETDSVRWYALCGQCVRAVAVDGLGPDHFEQPPLAIVC